MLVKLDLQRCHFLCSPEEKLLTLSKILGVFGNNLLLVVCLCLICFQSNGQTELSIGPLSSGQGNILSVADNPYSIFGNPATSPNQQRYVGLWVENRFLVQDFSVIGIVVGFKNISFGFRGGGNQFISEYNPSLGYQVNISNKFSLGSGISYFHNRVANETQSSLNRNVSGNLGISYQLTEKISVHSAARNFIQSQKSRQFLKPQIFELACSFQPDSTLNFNLAYQTGIEAYFIISIAYQISNLTQISYACNLANFSNHFGFNFKTGFLKLFISMYYRYNLGITPSAGTVYYHNPKTFENN